MPRRKTQPGVKGLLCHGRQTECPRAPGLPAGVVHPHTREGRTGAQQPPLTQLLAPFRAQQPVALRCLAPPAQLRGQALPEPPPGSRVLAGGAALLEEERQLQPRLLAYAGLESSARRASTLLAPVGRLSLGEPPACCASCRLPEADATSCSARLRLLSQSVPRLSRACAPHRQRLQQELCASCRASSSAWPPDFARRVDQVSRASGPALATLEADLSLPTAASQTQ